MPPTKKPAASRSPARTAFKEPAALKRLGRSLDAAQEALAELRKDTGRDVSQGARDLYKDLRTFVSSARRDSGKLAKALAHDFERAEKELAAAPRSRSRTTATRRSSRQTAARRTSSKTT
jgi:hypothetical protein